MSSIFNFRRFWLLIKRHGLENYKMYTLAWGVMALIILFICAIGSRGSALLGMFPVMLCFAGALMTNTLFSPWSNFGKASLCLMLPATTGEKFASALFYCIVLFIPLFTVSYFLTGFMFLKLFWPSITPSQLYLYGKEIYSPAVFLDIFMAFFLLQALSLVGTIWFRKRQFLISIFMIVLIFLIFVLVIYVTTYAITGREVATFLLPFYNYGFGFTSHSSDFEYYHFTHFIGRTNYFVWFVATFLLYVASWLKLREREL